MVLSLGHCGLPFLPAVLCNTSYSTVPGTLLLLLLLGTPCHCLAPRGCQGPGAFIPAASAALAVLPSERCGGGGSIGLLQGVWEEVGEEEGEGEEGRRTGGEKEGRWRGGGGEEDRGEEEVVSPSQARFVRAW